MANEDDRQRSTLPIPDLAYTGTVTYDATSPDTHYPPIKPVAPARGRAERAGGPDRRRRVRRVQRLRRPVQTPTFERVAARGAEVHPLPHHGALLADPGRAAVGPQPPHRRHGRHHRDRHLARPGYSSLRPNNCAPLAETLKLNGYNTAQFGKCHEVPVWESSPIGPFDHWPNPGGGFEYFYGFIGGETNQWYPAIYENTTPVEPWGTPEEGYHFMDDMTDKAIDWTTQQKSLAPDKPFFTYFAPGRHARPAPRADGVGRQVQGQVRPGLGRGARGDLRPAEGARRHPRRRGAHRAQRRHPGVGRDDRADQARARPRDGGLRRLPRVRRPPRRPADRRARGARRSRQHPRLRDHRRQRRVGRGHAATAPPTRASRSTTWTSSRPRST